MTRRLGIPSTVPTADLIQRVQARPGWSVPGLAETMEQIDSALKLQKVTETNALAWIGELYGFAARLGLVRPEGGFMGGEVQKFASHARAEIAKVIVGQEEVVSQMLAVCSVAATHFWKESPESPRRLR